MQPYLNVLLFVSPSSHEFRTKIESQIGPRDATLQPKQGRHAIFRDDNIR
jgi:hypothetical protein